MKTPTTISTDNGSISIEIDHKGRVVVKTEEYFGEEYNHGVIRLEGSTSAQEALEMFETGAEYLKSIIEENKQRPHKPIIDDPLDI